jgi:hypothetical protein
LKFNEKLSPVETSPSMEKGIKENDGGNKFN